MKYLIVMIGLIATIGCQRKNDNGTVTYNPVLPGACSAVVTDYTGAIDPALTTQTVAVNADVIGDPGKVAGDSKHPSYLVSGDTIEVSLCDATGCHDSVPSSFVSIGANQVVLNNAPAGGYTSYAIHTTVCQ